VYYEDTVEK